MSGLDYAKAKRLARVGPRRAEYPRGLGRRWRTDYPEDFPVTVAQLAEVQAILDEHGITLDAINEHIAAEEAGIAEGVIVPLRRPA